MSDNQGDLFALPADDHALAKLWDICVALTRTLPADTRAHIVAVGAAGPEGYRFQRTTGNLVSVNLTLPDGSVIHLGTFNMGELYEPFFDEAAPG